MSNEPNAPFVKVQMEPKYPQPRHRVPYKLIEKQTLCRIITTYMSTFDDAPNSEGAKIPMTRGIWAAIAQEYNRCFPDRRRHQKQLRKCWENMKNRGLPRSPLYAQFMQTSHTQAQPSFETTTTHVRVLPETTSRFESKSDIESPINSDHSSRINEMVNNIPENQQSGNETSNKNNGSTSGPTPPPNHGSRPPPSIFNTSPHGVPFASSNHGNRMPGHTLLNNNHYRQRNFGFRGENRNRCQPYPRNPVINRQQSAEKAIEDEKALRMKLLRAKILQIKQQMRHAEAVHDVTMRMLRTKATLYDKQMNNFESTHGGAKNNSNNDFSFFNESNFDSEFDDLISP